MNTMVKSCNGITMVPMEARLLEDRKIFLEGEINQQSAMEFVRQIMLLVKEDSRKPIDIMMNSPGGSINAGLVIYDVLQSLQTPVRMFCMGAAYSMGALLFAGGPKGSRFMLPNSELMLHEPLLGSRVGGNASSIHSISESLMETRRKVNGILAKHTGKTVEEIEEATRFDHYFSAEESVAFGLADRIVDFREMMEG